MAGCFTSVRFFVFSLLFFSAHTGIAADSAIATVKAQVETPPLFDDEEGGEADADDPAIWLHPQHPRLSLVIGTKKNAGLSVYNLKGQELQAIPAPPAPRPDDAPGRFNNVDVLYGFPLGGRTVDLAITTDRGRDHLRFYVIDPDALKERRPPLIDVTAENVPFVFSANQSEVNDQTTAYGLAVWKDDSGAAYAFVSQRSRTVIAKVLLFDTGDGHVSYTLVGSLTLPKSFTLPNSSTWESCQDPGDEPQVEGMVVDVELGILYAGQEDIGIWRITTDLTNPVLIDKVREYGIPWEFDAEEEECLIQYDNDPGFGGQHVSADVEGFTIYYGRNLSGYLLASSQGDNTFAVYQRTGNNAYIGSFQIADRTGRRQIDGVQECDGAAVLNIPFGRAFPLGLLVTQDGHNTPDVLDNEDEARANTNFKFIRWDSIARAFDDPLLIDTRGWHPRR